MTSSSLARTQGPPKNAQHALAPWLMPYDQEKLFREHAIAKSFEKTKLPQIAKSRGSMTLQVPRGSRSHSASSRHPDHLLAETRPRSRSTVCLQRKGTLH